MMKIFYGNQNEQFNNEGHKIKRNIDKIIENNISKNSKGNIIDVEESNVKKLINKNEKKSDGYIYYGKNRLFKTKKSAIFLSDTKNNKMKTQIIFVKVNNKNKFFHRNLSDNKIGNDENFNCNYHINNKIDKKLSGNISNNSIYTKELIFRKTQNKYNHNNSSRFPYITKNIKESEHNILQNIQKSKINNNLNIEFHRLNQLHKNIINLLKNRKNTNNEKDLFDTNIKYKKIKIRKYYSQRLIKENRKKQDKIITQTKRDFNAFKLIKNNFEIFEKTNLLNNQNNNNKISQNHSLKNDYKEIKNDDIKKDLNKNLSNRTFKTNINVFKNYIFSNPNQNQNFSFRSLKNMKISQNDSEKMSKKNYKTSTFFFSPKFKKISKQNSLNVNEIINIAIENNIKAGQAYMTSAFYNIGRNYDKKVKNNFYSTSYEKKWEREQEKEKINKEYNKAANDNILNLFLFEAENWEKHENIWRNIKQNLDEKNLIYILPPNDEDILISSYIKLYIKKNENIKSIISICINDENIKNPRKEIKKWKIAYKNSLLRWHPDKLFPLLKELNIKNQIIINELRRRANIIINNINNTYQKIVEILNKILLFNENNV